MKFEVETLEMPDGRKLYLYTFEDEAQSPDNEEDA